VDPRKIEVMKHCSFPKTLKCLCVFFGLIGYYCKFFHKYGNIYGPLIVLLKKNSFSWNLAADQSNQALKEDMCMTLVLALLDFTNTFVLECDA
jgi:hypothetical protein